MIDPSETDKLEQLKRKLYEKNPNLKRANTKNSVLRGASSNVPMGWDIKAPEISNKKESSAPEKEKPNPFLNIMPKSKTYKTKASIYKKFFIFSISFFVLAISFATYKFYSGSGAVSSDNVIINILGNTFVAGGDELSLQIEVENKNSVALESSDLVIEYPKGSSTDQSSDFDRKRISLGTIPSGKSSNQNIKLTLYGEQGSTKDIKATVEYRVKDSNAIFVKETHYAVNISSAPLALSVVGPVETSPNQEVTLVIKTTLNAPQALEDMRLAVAYPPGFEYTDSTPKPNLSNDVWNLGDLKTGIERDITIKGKLLGIEGENKSFRVYAGTIDPKDDTRLSVVYNSFLQTIALKKPFLEAKLAISGQDAQVVTAPSGDITANISYTNNLNTKVDDVEIRATFSGSAFDPNKVIAGGGFYDSNTNTLLWDKNTLNSLATLEPSENGTISFSIKSLPLYSNTLISDPQIIISLSIKGSQGSLGGGVSSVENTDQKIIKINSDFHISGKALYGSGPLANTGPIPPKVGHETTYTIVWTLSNSSNSISGADVRTTIPSYVRYIGNPNTSESLSYNPSSREIVWVAGAVPKGAGLIAPPREVSFQVGFTPSSSQIGSVTKLIDDTIVSGTDLFTGAILSDRKNQISTDLYNDPTFPPSGGVIVP